MPKEPDPLGFVVLDESGGGRLQGSALQDLFAAPPYGWSKDATRYLFAALLVAGEIELHTPSRPIRTSGPMAQEALNSTVAFNRIGVSRGDSRPSAEALDCAASGLQEMFGVDVLALCVGKIRRSSPVGECHTSNCYVNFAEHRGTSGPGCTDFQDNRDYIKRSIKYEIFYNRFGVSEAGRVLLEGDPQVMKGV